MKTLKLFLLLAIAVIFSLNSCSNKQALVKTNNDVVAKEATTTAPSETVKEVLEVAKEVATAPSGTAKDELGVAKEEPGVAGEMVDEAKALIPEDKRLVKGKLANGMHYYIQKNKKPENRAELRLAVNAGSVQEDDDQKGLAHFVEHMAFNGTKNFEKSELVDYLESIGTQFGPDLNAYTSFDETVYMLQVRTDSIELFDKGMLVIRDWANDVTFEDEEIDKERGVIESEWRTRLSPDQRMQNEYYPKMLKGSKYADRLPIGDMDIVNNAPYDALKRYYRDWYRPDLMAVVVVGDINVDKVEDQIKTLFGDIELVEDARERTQIEVPMHEETVVSVVSDEEAAFTQVQLMYKHDKKEVKTLADYKKALVRSLYNTMMGARLEELSKSADPPFMFANTSYGRSIGNMDTYSSFAFVPEGKAPAALETLLTENKRVLLHGFTQGELDRAKDNMMNRAEKGLKEMNTTESRRIIGQYVYKYLRGNNTPGPDQRMGLYEKYLPGITLKQINALPSKWIKEDSRVIVVTGPKKEETPLPAEDDVFNILASTDEAMPEAYVDEVIEAPFFEKTLEAAEIASEKMYDNVGIEYMELANGVEVYLKATKFKTDEILMQATSPGGSSLYEEAMHFSPEAAASIVKEAGLGQFNATQIDKLMTGKTVSVTPYVRELSEGFSGSASPDDLETMFQMIYQYFYAPRTDGEAFTSYCNKEKGFVKNMMSDPRFFFNNEVSKIKYNGNTRALMAEAKDYDELVYEDVMKHYNERFADASDFTFFFTGNFEKDNIKGLIQKYLGNLPDTDREENWKDVNMKAVEGNVVERFKNGVAPKTSVNMYFHGSFEYNKANNYVMSSAISYLRIKLRETMREDMGGVYGVRIGGSGKYKPREEYGITVSFNADPPMADELIAAAKKVIQTAIDEVPSDIDMTKVKETQKQRRIKSLEENRYWQGQMVRKHDYKKDFDDILLPALEAKIESLTAEQIQNAVKQYFNYDSYIEVVMEPEGEE